MGGPRMSTVCFQPLFDKPEPVIHKFVTRSFQTPQAVELVYLPFYLFIYKVKTLSLLGRLNTFHNIMLVDLVGGEPTSINRQTFIEASPELTQDFPVLPSITEIQKNNKIKQRLKLIKQELPENSLLPPILRPKEAVNSARKIFKYDFFRLAGGFGYKRVEIVPDFDGLTVYYPIWLVYYSDRKKHMHLKAFNGLTLEKESGNFLLAIKKALLEKHLPQLQPKEEK
jgi:hypothetical protein